MTPGKWNVVMLWTTYCGVCRGQYPMTSEFHARHQATDAVVPGISLDGLDAAERVSAYRMKQAQRLPRVLSEFEVFSRMYEVATGEVFTGTPSYLVFDDQGALRAHLAGPTGLAALERAIAP